MSWQFELLAKLCYGRWAQVFERYKKIQMLKFILLSIMKWSHVKCTILNEALNLFKILFENKTQKINLIFFNYI